MQPWQLTFAEHTWTSDQVPTAVLLVVADVAGPDVDVSSPWVSMQSRFAWLVGCLSAQLGQEPAIDDPLTAATLLVHAMPHVEFLTAVAPYDPASDAPKRSPQARPKRARAAAKATGKRTRQAGPTAPG